MIHSEIKQGDYSQLKQGMEHIILMTSEFFIGDKPLEKVEKEELYGILLRL